MVVFRFVLFRFVRVVAGLLLTDLTFMDDANLTELGKGDAGQKLLNFSKLHMLAGAYRSFRRCISRPYTLSEVKSVNKVRNRTTTPSHSSGLCCGSCFESRSCCAIWTASTRTSCTA